MTLLGEIFAAVLGGLGVLGTTLMLARRKLSRDGVEVVKDRAEIDIIAQLTKQRDEALNKLTATSDTVREAENQKQLALMQVLELSKEVSMLNDQALLMQELIDRLSDTLDATKDKLAEILVNERAKGSDYSTSQTVDNFD